MRLHRYENMVTRSIHQQTVGADIKFYKVACKLFCIEKLSKVWCNERDLNGKGDALCEWLRAANIACLAPTGPTRRVRFANSNNIKRWTFEATFIWSVIFVTSTGITYVFCFRFLDFALAFYLIIKFSYRYYRKSYRLTEERLINDCYDQHFLSSFEKICRLF